MAGGWVILQETIMKPALALLTVLLLASLASLNAADASAALILKRCSRLFIDHP